MSIRMRAKEQNGLVTVKALVKHPMETGQRKAKDGSFLKVCVDKSGKDVNRVCYESYDPDIYYHEDSEMWCEIMESRE